MKKTTSLFLLSAGILLSLAGCQKGTETNGNEGRAVRFGAVTGVPGTRTAYSGIVDEATKKERIDWVAGDKVMIASDKAVDRLGNGNKYATYRLSGVTDDGYKSHAQINDDEGKGLVWGNDASEEYTFWGIYPASTGDGAKLTTGTAVYTIPSSQSYKDTKTDANGNVTVNPNMDNAVMLAKITGAKASDSPVDLQFYPGFTAFEFTMKAHAENENDITVKSVEVVASSGCDIAGPVTAAIAVNDGTTYTIGEGSESLTFAFPDNSVIPVGGEKTLTFTVFATPQVISGLTLNFTLGDNSVRTARLKKNGADIEFAKCNKHRIYGLAMPEGDWHLYLETDILQWIDGSAEITYGTTTADGVVISAAALEYTGEGASSWGRTAATLLNRTDALKAYFSVYSPTDGYWRITLKGSNPAGFDVSIVNFAAAAVTNGSVTEGENTYNYLQGAVDGRVIFTVAANENADSGDTVELWFSVIDKNGKEYTVLSEVTRDATKPLTITL